MTQDRTAERRILIVDDDPNIVQVLTDILTEEGYEVVTALQSLRAFDRMKESQPDLILMELRMPYVDGIDLVKLLTLDDDLKDIPVIMLTAITRIDNGLVLDLMGGLGSIRAWVHKPCDIALLLGIIEKVLKGEKGRIDNEVFQIPHQSAFPTLKYKDFM